ncbi:hypothetical protein EW146_g3395 [Bondarzewia mesenterica]|uniref:SAC domain-containing protein n=1 Tax=Bondarzewia mesenterica TaxID=1095465 RepID=A0A4S4LXM9_9AGAM|nr:hypothetical protein EW146_g3395 [Bondarzewia mesenterica]
MKYLQGEESYIFVPAEPVGARPLVVYRNSGDIVLEAPNFTVPSNAKRSGKTIYGILGLIPLVLSEYLIVITGRELRGTLLGHAIYRAVDFEILSLDPTVSVSTPPHPVEAHLLALVRSHLKSGVFLFSYSFDLTRRLQAQWVAQEQDDGRAFWEVADDRFFWNKYLQSRFMDITVSNPKNDLSSYILPITYGSFDIRLCSLNGQSIQMSLISRRSRFRAGTRYFRRGIDHDGHVANFIETEQIVLVGGSVSDADDFSHKLSFVQIRGSVPVFWAEVNTLRYKPDLQIMDFQNSNGATRRHLQEQVSLYGDQTVVNLVDQKGHEKPVKDAYERNFIEANVEKVKYQYFDFHNECKHMRWDRISLLLDSITEDLQRDGYFHLDSASPEPVEWQLGVVRTNCMDNLDRTNVAQAAIAKWTLNKQLKDVGVLAADDAVDNHEDISRHIREMWSDHADYISRAYAGTGALKTDFTRTGKRTRAGAFDDLQKQVVSDHHRSGFVMMYRYRMHSTSSAASRHPFDPLRAFLLFVHGPRRTYIASFVRSDFSSSNQSKTKNQKDYSLSYYFAFWILILSLSLAFIFIHGIDYVAWPRLLPPTDVIHYNGPGFRSAHNGKGFGMDIGKLKAGASAQWLASGVRRTDKQVEEIELGTKKRVD